MSQHKERKGLGTVASVPKLEWQSLGTVPRSLGTVPQYKKSWDSNEEVLGQ